MVTGVGVGVNVPSGWTTGVTVFSLDTDRHYSLGNVFGVEYDSLSAASLSTTPSAGNVLAFTNSGPGLYPFNTYIVPASVATTLSGVTLDAVVVLFDGSGSIVDVSNADRVVVQ